MAEDYEGVGEAAAEAGQAAVAGALGVGAPPQTLATSLDMFRKTLSMGEQVVGEFEGFAERFTGIAGAPSSIPPGVGASQAAGSVPALGELVGQIAGLFARVASATRRANAAHG